MSNIKKTKTLDMTEGNIAKLLITFAIPLLLGNIFQYLYNTVDSLVVGNFVGKEALAAVGSTTYIINTLVMFFGGISVGASVIISRYFGAHDDETLHRAIETTMALTFIGSVLCTVAGIALSPLLLRFMDTPEDVLPSSSVYLRIYFGGITGLMVYNMGSGILRAVGDTKRPLYFLIFSSIMNIILDLLFVVVFSLGIAGVAYATVLAQMISAVLVLMLLTKTKEKYRLIWKDLRVDMQLTKEILSVGFPVGLQQAVTSFSNVYVQSYINSFGSAGMAGWSSFTKIDSFLALPLQSIAQAITTFAGQNVGAKNLSRVKDGVKTALKISVPLIFVMACFLYVFAPQLVSLFNRDPEVVYYGTLFMRLCVMVVPVTCLTQIFSGTMRGAGSAKIPMYIMLTSYVVFRQIYLFIMSSLAHSPYTIGFGYSAGWILCALLTTLAYKFSGWEKRAIK
ncbi:MAG: MATE family efflux transporter [Lachnospiraceae bacterium]|nr:MATE family efflux transporter [Lachnospiraceae bacterium]